MSGQDIIIEQLREELEKAHAASEYQTRRIEHYRTQLDFCERRAEKAERFPQPTDSEWKVRAEKAERERDEWKARHDTLADVSRKCIATAERERDEARANYAFMVERAADQKLDGYRELGARAAAAEERAERAERERDEALRRRTRAERVGEAVIEWASRQTAELITEYAKALERHDWKPHAELTYAIADALKEADDAE